MIIRIASARAVLKFEADKICARCLSKLSRPVSAQTPCRVSMHNKRRIHGSIVPDKLVAQQMPVTAQRFIHDYFSANSSIDRGWLKNGVLATWLSIAESPRPTNQTSKQDDHSLLENTDIDKMQQPTLDVQNNSVSAPHSLEAVAPTVLPHRRRRQRLKQTGTVDPVIPPDASSQLTTAATNLPSTATLRRSVATYLSLTKPRLSFLILLTTTTSYSLYPIPEILSSTSSLAPTTLSTSTLTLAYLTTGTFLSCACANTFNMLFEPQYDALMSRTRNRPLVRKLVSPRAALIFAVLCGASGLALLYLGTNPTVAGLSALNIFLYAGVYTPMKRISVLNTWVGAIVGGIPPLMGWTAAAGLGATSEHHSWQDMLFSEGALGGWLLAALLFAWQFPHFNALSHGIKDEYRNAGYRMLAWTNPARNGRVAIRYSLLMFPICAGLWWVGVVDGSFLFVSTACNAWMTKEAISFWRRGGAGGSARGLFWASVWQLPLVLVGALVCKQGIWQGVWDQGVHANAVEEKQDEDEDEVLDEHDEQGQGIMDVDSALKSIKRIT